MLIPDRHELTRAKLKIQALENDSRQKILQLLADGQSMTVTEVQFALRTSQSTASKHLTTLRRAGFLESKKVDKNKVYFLKKEGIDNEISLIHQLAK